MYVLKYVLPNIMSTKDIKEIPLSLAFFLQTHDVLIKPSYLVQKHEFNQ